MPSSAPHLNQLQDRDLYQLMLQHSHEVICLHDAHGRYLYVGHAIKAKLGYAPGEIIGSLPWDLIHPADREALQKSFTLAFEDVHSAPVREYRYKLAGGGYKWLQSQVVAIRNSLGQIDKLLSTTRDISELVALRERNDTAERMLAQASHMATLGGWELDVQTMEPEWSKVTFEIHEWEESRPPRYEQALQFFPMPAQQKVAQCIAEAIEKGKDFDLVAPFISAKNNRKWVRSIGQALQRDGKTIKLIGVFQDVTRETEYNLALKNTARQLQHQKKLLQDFNQIISHNLRSPVTNLNLLTDFISRAENDSERNSHLNALKQVSTDIEDLLTDMTSVMRATKKDALPPVELDLKTILERVLRKLAAEIEETETVVEADFTAWQYFKYPEAYLETIFYNLIRNAIIYKSPGRAPQISITSSMAANHHQLSFNDNGSGIDLNRQGDKIFKIYKTFHRDRRGKGLGLYTVRSYLNALGGEISVESHPGRGSKFIVDFDFYNPTADWPQPVIINGESHSDF